MVEFKKKKENNEIMQFTKPENGFYSKLFGEIIEVILLLTCVISVALCIYCS